jgi:hypothetical protein
LTVAEGDALGHGVVRVSSKVLAFAYHLLFHCKKSDVLNLNLKIIIILYSKQCYYSLYSCIYEFSLLREYFDMILIKDVGVTTAYYSSASVRIHNATGKRRRRR